MQGLIGLSLSGLTLQWKGWCLSSRARLKLDKKKWSVIRKLRLRITKQERNMNKNLQWGCSPPPFLILPQAEINFNYFPSLAHDGCQDNEALTLNKYVALGLCLVEQRTRAACAWWGLGWSCSSSGVAGEHHSVIPAGMAGLGHGLLVKGSLERLLILPGEHSHLVCNGTAAGASKSPVKVGLYSFSSHSS